MSNSISALLFLIDMIHGFLAVAFSARLVFEFCRVPIQNPLVGFFLKVTNPIIRVFSQIFPTIGRVNLAALITIVGLNFVAVVLRLWLSFGEVFFLQVLQISILTMLPMQILNFLFWSTIVFAVFSWLPNLRYHPLAQLASSIIQPFLAPIQKVMPQIMGIDFSPVVLILLIGFFQRLIAG